MTMPAARAGDMHVCPMVTPAPVPIPHVGGPILPPGAPMVLIGGMPAARMGDMCICVGPPDVIVKGAMPVLMMGQPAARMSDQTAHGGAIVLGFPMVLIGLAGISGNVLAGIQRCQAMAAGRSPPPGAVDPNGNQLQPNTAGQSYNNCGIEVSRQMITQATGAPLTQEGLLNQATSNGWADNVPGNLYQSGGSNATGRQSLLAANGVPATQEAPNMSNIENSVAQERGVGASVWAGSMPNWAGQGLAPGTGAHAILVTGIEYDANGNPINVVINDTGMGQCGVKIPYAQFQNALKPTNLVVTNNPIW